MIKGNAFRVYLVLSGATGLFNALMFTLQQVYYVQVVGMNALQLVLAGTVMELATLVFEVPTGVVADTVSRTSWLLPSSAAENRPVRGRRQGGNRVKTGGQVPFFSYRCEGVYSCRRGLDGLIVHGYAEQS